MTVQNVARKINIQRNSPCYGRDAAGGICPRSENVLSTGGSTCTLKINADNTVDASSSDCRCAAPDGRELGESKNWPKIYSGMLTDKARRHLVLKNHRKFGFIM